MSYDVTTTDSRYFSVFDLNDLDLQGKKRKVLQ